MLMVVAIALGIVFFPLGLAFSLISSILSGLGRAWDGLAKYFLAISISVDQLGNVVCSDLFNALLIKKEAHKFGNPDHTISYILSINGGKLTWMGRMLINIIEILDPDHFDNIEE